MVTKFFRGLLISVLSAIIITFMVLFFTPLLPFNIFSGFIGILTFFGIIIISYLVYILMPVETSNSDSNSIDLNSNSSQNSDS
ncbi:MAG: hypothetical protein ACW964_19100 [Candidatus Hodarchaeales archaeon]